MQFCHNCLMNWFVLRQDWWFPSFLFSTKDQEKQHCEKIYFFLTNAQPGDNYPFSKPFSYFRWTHLPGLFWWLFAKRVILRFIFCLKTILVTIFDLAIIFWKNSLQNSLQMGNKPQNNPQKKVTKIILVDAFTFTYQSQ